MKLRLIKLSAWRLSEKHIYLREIMKEISSVFFIIKKYIQIMW